MSERVSPRERIMGTARSLFYRQGIQSTGVGELAEVAGVSKRTLYQLFPSKDDLITAYLRDVGEPGKLNERPLDRTDLEPRERLLALFDRPRLSAQFRGCPLHNASVELADSDHPARPVVVEYKMRVLGRIVETARAAGAEDPETLARQLLTLLEGAMALSTSLDDNEPFDIAKSAAVLLIDQSLSAGRRSR